VTAHTQFLIADAVSMIALSPLLIRAQVRQLPHRALLTWLYTVGYGLIAITFIVDSIFNPPMFFHGFTPGVGIGLLLAYVGRYVLDANAARRSQLAPRRAN
jgi:hypothetical protein